MPVSEEGLLGVNVTVIAGVLFFLTVSSVIKLGVSVLTPNYLASIIIIPFAYSAITILTIKPDEKGAIQKMNNAKIYANLIHLVKNFFEYCDIEISPRKFKLKIRLPKVVRKNKEALSKEDIIDILNACSDIRLKTYVMLLATGMRAVEALSIRIKDLDLKSNPAKVLVRGEYTKTKADRTVFLTEEIKQQLNSWLRLQIPKQESMLQR